MIADRIEGAPVERTQVAALARGAPRLRIQALTAGYGRMEILHGIDLDLGAGQSLCLIGPNGAGKSTVLNAIFGFADIKSGSVAVEGDDVTRHTPDAKLERCGIAYVLQDSSVFPDLTVLQNLRLGGYLLRQENQVRDEVERIFERHPVLHARRHEPARLLSGGERRLLEISRALMMNPRLLLVDEPSIGLEPRYVELVFTMLRELVEREGKSILIVEQNVRKGLAFADLGYVLVAGKVVVAAHARDLLHDPTIGRLFLGTGPFGV